jgi:hypothetical protein
MDLAGTRPEVTNRFRVGITDVVIAEDRSTTFPRSPGGTQVRVQPCVDLAPFYCQSAGVLTMLDGLTI